ncbi:MAG: hypothetical protein AAFP19_22595, partial [Bacteroidota bacterium]
FSQIEYHKDGSVKRVAQAGEHYRMGSGNETKYFYAVSGGELGFLYGFRKSHEVNVPAGDPTNPVSRDIEGNILAYKTITIGTDDIEHISFTDALGRPIANAVSGAPGTSNCTYQIAKHTLDFRSTQSTEIHLPAATKQSLKVGYGEYFVDNDPINYISLQITDIQSEQTLVEGTDYNITLGTGSYLEVTFLGTHANQTGYYRISFEYTEAYMDVYNDFFVPGSEPPVRVEYELDYTNWTINYYDERGRLVQSVQPKGIRCDLVDASQMGTFPFKKSHELVTGAPAVYSVNNSTFHTEILPPLQNGLGQEIKLTVKTQVKPGLVHDHWNGQGGGGGVGGAVVNAIPVNTIFNPFAPIDTTVNVPLGRMTDSEFEAAYPAISVLDIELGNLQAIIPPSVPEELPWPTDYPPSYCSNGVRDYSERGVDCGGHCQACPECEEEPDFLVAFEFEMHIIGTLQDNSQTVLGTRKIYRTLGMDCNFILVDLTPADANNTQFDYFVSDDVISDLDLKEVKVQLHRTRAKTKPENDFWYINPSNQAHRFVRYIYLRLDGQREVIFDEAIPHTMTETIVYDDLNRVTATEDPDRGVVEYMYDQEDKLRFSQDARQAELAYFTYYSYDDRGRLVETGEYRDSNYYFPAVIHENVSFPVGGISLASIVELNDGLPASPREDWTQFVFDEEGPSFPANYPDYKAEFVEGRVSMSRNSTHSTFYKYNHNGQLVASLKKYPELGLKTVDYQYDCFGRLVQSTFQQTDATEKFSHLYSYDLNGQIRTVETQKANELPKLHSSYEFYKLGQLRRTELGDNLQGVDYTYTVDGALKAINHPSLYSYDPGRDGYSGNHSDVAKDVFGMTIDYHSNDYVRKGTRINYGQDNLANDFHDGRIKSIRWNTRNDLQSAFAREHMFVYEYDWKQQLTDAQYGQYIVNFQVNNNQGNGGFSNPVHGAYLQASGGAYEVQGITYDANGNILSLERQNDSGEDLDHLSYIYEHSTVAGYSEDTNKLRAVKDDAGFLDQGDVQDQDDNNYTYNPNGEIIGDLEKDIHLIYNSFGKVDFIRNHANTRNVMHFTYDEMGNRMSKTTYDVNENPEKTTFYVREADGTIIATYEKDYADTHPLPELEEYMLDGGQLGIHYPAGNQYVYHLTDHLGNVRVTIDREKDPNGEA